MTSQRSFFRLDSLTKRGLCFLQSESLQPDSDGIPGIVQKEGKMAIVDHLILTSDPSYYTENEH